MRGKGLIIIILLSITGTVVGGFGGYVLGKSRAASIQTVKQQNAVTRPAEEKNLYNGDELTLAEMYDSVRSVSGDDFDWRLLVYLTSIRNIETGMLREAESRAKHQQLKDLAKIQKDQNEKVLPLLNQWQSDWGYSHH